jgi:hypothetical protein
MLAFMLIGIVSYLALIGTADKAINGGITRASTQASKSQPAEHDRNAPRVVKPGKAFIVGKHQTLAGWTVEEDTSLGNAMFSVTGNVKNISDAKSSAFIQFKFIDKSGDVIGNVQCNSADLKPGQSQALNCIPGRQIPQVQKGHRRSDQLSRCRVLDLPFDPEQLSQRTPPGFISRKTRVARSTGSGTAQHYRSETT